MVFTEKKIFGFYGKTEENHVEFRLDKKITAIFTLKLLNYILRFQSLYILYLLGLINFQVNIAFVYLSINIINAL